MSSIKFYKEKNLPLEMHKVRIVQKLNLLPIDERLEKIKEAVDIMQDIADKEELLENTALAFIESIEDTAINLRLVSYTTSTKWKEYMLLRSKIIAQTVDKFQKANISFDVPDSRISIENLSALKNI